MVGADSLSHHEDKWASATGGNVRFWKAFNGLKRLIILSVELLRNVKECNGIIYCRKNIQTGIATLFMEALRTIPILPGFLDRIIQTTPVIETEAIPLSLFIDGIRFFIHLFAPFFTVQTLTFVQDKQTLIRPL